MKMRKAKPILNHMQNLAKTPPMGWSSWNHFGVEVCEYLVKDIAEALIESGMREAGYVYINLDDGWMARRRDQDGNLRADPDKFPSGIKTLAKYLHERGLKLGLYGDGGTMTCQRYPGNLDHEKQDAKLYAFWEIDYFKEDWCYAKGLDKREKYTLMRDCLRSTGRPIIFGICTASFPGPWVTEVGHLWRTARDIGNNWKCIPEIIDINAELAEHAGPGHWNDADMLQVGNGGMTTPECRSHFGMWCMMAAPLIAGNDVRNLSRDAEDILTSPEVIDVDQDALGVQGKKVKKEGDQEIWVKPLKGDYIAVALFNRGTEEAEISVRWLDIGYPRDTARVRDLWQRKDLGSFKLGLTIKVAPHDTHMLCVFEGRRKPETNAHQPNALRCENMENPMNVRTTRPWFSWSFECFDIVHRQSAYQILVAESRKALAHNQGNVWDSKKRRFLDTWARYDGPELKDGATFYWKVRVWDAWNQVSKYSGIALFAIDPERRVGPAQPTNLRCAGKVNPVNVANYPPKLSWSFNSPAVDDYQTAFRLLASDSLDILEHNEGDCWDTGKLYSTKQSILYSGKGLDPGRNYYWKIMTWNTSRMSGPFSQIASFSMRKAPGYNLLLDGSFENDGYGWHGVTHTDRAVVTSEAYRGKKSLLMKCSPVFGRRIYQDVDIQGGTSYLAESWMKTDSVHKDGVQFKLIWLKARMPKGAATERYALREETVACIFGSMDWTHYSGCFQAPKDANAVRFQIVMTPDESGAKVWIDNNRLIPSTKQRV